MEELLDDFITEEEVVRTGVNKKLIGGLWVQLGFALLATGLAIEDIETIIGTGPIGFFIGLIVFVFARKFKFFQGKKIGLSMPIFTVSCFSLIYFLDWSPTEAQVPISTLMGVYTIGLWFFVIKEVRNNPNYGIK